MACDIYKRNNLFLTKNKEFIMKKKKHLHTQFVRFLIESENKLQAQEELEEVQKDFEESDDDEVILPSKKDKKVQEPIDDENADEVIDDENADEVIEKLIQQKNRYKREYENILYGRKRK
jgi:hypothetical protein